MPKNRPPDWEAVLSAASRLQSLLPGATLVGGTAAAIFAGHRVSYDADHVLVDLRGRFDEVLADIESAAGWRTARVKRPVLILGSLDGIETGIRQLIRSEPLETETVTVGGQSLRIPTEGEVLRIKGALILRRNATRDYIDFAALADRLGLAASRLALGRLDRLYPQPTGESPLHQLCIQLADPRPFDLEGTDVASYKNLAEKWREWANVERACRAVSVDLFKSLPSAGGDGAEERPA